MKTRNVLAVTAFAVGAVCLSGLGLVAGAAAGQGIAPISAPSGLRAVDGTPSTPAPAPDYAVNASGQTYGSDLQATSPATQPDLVQVVASNGQTGYAYSSALDAAAGPSTFASPADALKWQEQVAGTTTSVPVYAVDGTTVIGEFITTHPTMAQIQANQQSAGN